jgi:hypothetical protein
MDKIAKAFIAAKKDFSPVLKDKNNPFFKSKYADLASCLEAVNDALLNNGIALYQQTFEDQTGVMVQTVMLHESGESIQFGLLHVPAAKQDPQGYGSALTYARRYSLITACGIAPEDDDGNAASKPVKNTGYDTYESEFLPVLKMAAMSGTDELHKVFKGIQVNEFKAQLWANHSKRLKEAAELADGATK